jgi:flap endonuclease-1
MGIKNLHKLLKKFEGIVVEKKPTSYQGKKIAIDVSILIYQIVIAIRNTGSDLTNNNGDITSHLYGIFNKTVSMLEMGIHPVYVFDGKPPEMKNDILKSRREQRNKAKIRMSAAVNKAEKIKYFKRSVVITKKQLEECKTLLKLIGIPVINAPEEADSQCAWLAKNDMVYGVSTEDMDILTFGSPIIIRNLSSRKKNSIEIGLNNIKNKLKLNYLQFIDLCILLGCDYCPTLSGVGMKKAYSIIQKYNSIDNFLSSEEFKDMKIKVPPNFVNRKYKTIEYFQNPKIKEIKEEELAWHEPKYNLISEFMVNNFGFGKSMINRKLNKLRKLYKVHSEENKQNINIII